MNVQGIPVANMTIDQVIYYLGRVDTWLINNHIPPKAYTAGELRIALVNRYNNLTGSNVATAIANGPYGAYDTLDRALLAQSLTASQNVNHTVTVHTPLQTFTTPVTPTKDSLNNAAKNVIRDSPKAVRVLEQKAINNQIACLSNEKKEEKLEQTQDELNETKEELTTTQDILSDALEMLDLNQSDLENTQDVLQTTIDYIVTTQANNTNTNVGINMDHGDDEATQDETEESS